VGSFRPYIAYNQPFEPHLAPVRDSLVDIVAKHYPGMKLEAFQTPGLPNKEKPRIRWYGTILGSTRDIPELEIELNLDHVQINVGNKKEPEYLATPVRFDGYFPLGEFESATKALLTDMWSILNAVSDAGAKIPAGADRTKFPVGSFILVKNGVPAASMGFALRELGLKLKTPQVMFGSCLVG